MSRTSPKKTAAVQTETPPAAGAKPEPAAPPAPEAPRLGWGWKLAITVWLAGLVGLGLYEVVGMLWRLLIPPR